MSTPLHTLAKVPSGGSLADALADALSGRPFNDVAFYTARSGGGGGAPRAVHANRRVLVAASKYFRELLAEEGGGGSMPSSSDETSATSADGRDSVPDHEDDDSDASESLLATPSEVSFEGDEEIKLPDSASEDTKSVTTAVSAASGTRVITLDNATFDTLAAVVFYIYTGKVYFRPLRSQDPASCEDAQAGDAREHSKRPTCCCKAVYRFADEAGLDELKGLADAHLAAQLDKDTILDELFSPFSAQHPGILRRQVTLLLQKHWTSATRAALGPVVERIVRGEMPHAAPALAALLGEISACPARSECSPDGTSKAPLPPGPPPTDSPPHARPRPGIPSKGLPATNTPSAVVSPARLGRASGCVPPAGHPPVSIFGPIPRRSAPGRPSAPPGPAAAPPADGASAGTARAAAECAPARDATPVGGGGAPARASAVHVAAPGAPSTAHAAEPEAQPAAPKASVKPGAGPGTRPALLFGGSVLPSAVPATAACGAAPASVGDARGAGGGGRASKRRPCKHCGKKGRLACRVCGRRAGG